MSRPDVDWGQKLQSALETSAKKTLSLDELLEVLSLPDAHIPIREAIWEAIGTGKVYLDDDYKIVLSSNWPKSRVLSF